MPHACRVRLVFLRVLAASAVALCCAATALAGPVPPAVKALLPTSASFKDGSVSVVRTAMVGNVHADLGGFRQACDPTLSNDVRIDLRADSSWTPAMVKVMQSKQAKSIQTAKTSLAAHAAGRKQAGGKTVASVGEVKEETVPGGTIVYVEYVEDCAQARNHPVTILRGFGQSGTVFAEIFVNTTGSAADTRKIAMESLAKIQQFKPESTK